MLVPHHIKLLDITKSSKKEEKKKNHTSVCSAYFSVIEFVKIRLIPLTGSVFVLIYNNIDIYVHPDGLFYFE